MGAPTLALGWMLDGSFEHSENLTFSPLTQLQHFSHKRLLVSRPRFAAALRAFPSMSPKCLNHLLPRMLHTSWRFQRFDTVLGGLSLVCTVYPSCFDWSDN